MGSSLRRVCRSQVADVEVKASVRNVYVSRFLSVEATSSSRSIYGYKVDGVEMDSLLREICKSRRVGGVKSGGTKTGLVLRGIGECNGPTSEV